MTTKSDTSKASSRPATESELAAMHFDPWPELAGTPLLSELSDDRVSAHIAAARTAVRTMYLSKAELAVILGGADNDSGRAFMENFTAAKDFFAGFATLLRAADARILVAGSYCVQGTKAADRELRKICRGQRRAL